MKNNGIDSWIDFFFDRGVSRDQINRYIPYITKLNENNCPIIFEKQHLAHLIGINEDTLNAIISCPNKFYRTFNIPKKKGGFRKIVSPYPSLLMCQQWIYKNILLSTKPHDACHGFTPGRSIITNASAHLGNSCILKLDLKDFFPTIPINWVINHFQSLGYANNVSFYLSSICTYDKKLAQGAATSPYLSNLLLKNLDDRLFNLSKKYHLSYSRYADDMCFSGKYIPTSFRDFVIEIINNFGLKINPEKTSLLINAKKKIVTGISVSGQKTALPRDYKRKLKNELFFIKKYGYIAHITHQKIKDPNYLLSIIGRINFWLQVEPENQIAVQAKKYLAGILESEK